MSITFDRCGEVRHHESRPVGTILNIVTELPQPEFLEPPTRIDGPVSLAAADPEWASQYAREEERIRGALGSRVVQVEHVGSTSVSGLAAKPVIDILLVVLDSADEAGYLPDLEAAGYRLQFREPEWYEHRFLRDSTRTCRCTCSASGLRRWSGCCSSAIGCAADPKIVSCMNGPSVSSLSGGGSTFRITPTPSPLSSRKSS